MQKMFYPESVMVYGVSSSSNNLGRNTVENLERFGFKGSVYLVGRKENELSRGCLVVDAKIERI
jgi:acyl-CoA synthetase (NDP forming)